MPISCGSTREDRCPPCADRAKRPRIQQCRKGWHLDTEPEHDPSEPDQEPEDEAQDDDDSDRRVRSTRCRQDAPDLPRMPMEDRTIGRAFTTPDGMTYRPSMFLTLTLGSYGRVTSEGVPVDPASYDYRRAALDALHFPKLVDRFWQNLRRCAGYQVQYFAAVEAQRRLAPHLHAAVRGAIPRKVVREVRAATYHHIWWPAHDEPVYVDQLPRWSDAIGGYVDPATGTVLPTWDQALDALDTNDEANPAHVVRFGEQDDLQGLIAGTPGVDRAIGYLCKCLTKTIAATHDTDDVSAARTAHIDRLADELRWLPCAPTCANWLRFGVQPKGAGPAWCPATANTRPTTGRISGSAAAGCSCHARGPARPSPATGPTGPQSCGPPSRKPASTPTTTTSCPSRAPTAAGPGNYSAAPESTRPPTRRPSRNRSPPASGGGPSTRPPKPPGRARRYEGRVCLGRRSSAVR